MPYKDKTKAREYERVYYQKNRERINAQHRDLYRRSEARRNYIREYGKTEKAKEWRRNHKLKLRYNISQEDYDKMLAEQNGVCAICEKEPSGNRKLYVDHNHTTGIIRGLLCTGCNQAVGFFEIFKNRGTADIERYLENEPLPRHD